MPPSIRATTNPCRVARSQTSTAASAVSFITILPAREKKSSDESYAIMIDTHHVHFHFIRPSGNHVGSFFPLTWTTSSVMSFNHPEIQTRSPSHFWEYHPGSSTRPDCPSPFKSDHRQRLIFSVKSIRASGHETGENSERILSKSICHRDMPIREYAIAYEDRQTCNISPSAKVLVSHNVNRAPGSKWLRTRSKNRNFIDTSSVVPGSNLCPSLSSNNRQSNPCPSINRGHP